MAYSNHQRDTKEHKMTTFEALKKYAEVYKSYQIFKERTFNIDVATKFAVDGIISQCRGKGDEYLIWFANDEANYILEAMEREKS